MHQHKLTLFFLAGGIALFLLLTSWDEPVDLAPGNITAAKAEVENSPAIMTGCKAYPDREAPKIVYEPVIEKFLAFPCALEVPPPFGVVELVKRRPVHNIGS